jgi:hypothetical protein
LLRRLPPEMAARLAARSRGWRAGGAGGDEAANASGAPRREQQQGARPSGQDGEGRPPGERPGRWQNGDGPRAGRGGFDFQEVLERLPALSIDELKPGDMIIVSSTVGAEASRVTAIKLVAGVDEILNAAQRRPGRQGAGSVDSGAGFDSGPIDFGIGLP